MQFCRKIHRTWQIFPNDSWLGWQKPTLVRAVISISRPWKIAKLQRTCVEPHRVTSKPLQEIHQHKIPWTLTMEEILLNNLQSNCNCTGCHSIPKWNFPKLVFTCTRIQDTFQENWNSSIHLQNKWNPSCLSNCYELRLGSFHHEQSTVAKLYLPCCKQTEKYKYFIGNF